MSLIKPKRRRGPRMLWLILVTIFILVALGLYVYLTMNGVNNSNEVKARYVDYLFYLEEPGGGSYYYLLTSNDGRSSLVTFPVYSTIENSKEVLDPKLEASAMKLIQSWLNTSSDYSYYVRLSNTLLSNLSESLGIKATNAVQLIDGMAMRGFKLLDYWKLGGFSKTIKEFSPSTTITPKGMAVLLKRLSTSSRMAYQVETLTQYPLKIKVGVTGESVNRLYIKNDSIESVKKALAR